MTRETPDETCTWRAVSASRRGSAHAEGVPNQDAVHLRRVARAAGYVWVVGVADGHGGARYVRSDVGSRAAVDIAVDALSEALQDDDDAAAALRATVPRIVAAWRERVEADARDRPFSDDELHRGAGGTTAYGATLLCAVVGDFGVALAQVGDGDALVRSHGFATRPVPGDDRLVAGETTSLCLDSAVDDFRYATVPASAEPDLVLIATDGYGNSFAQATWWHGLVDDVAALVVRSGFDRVADDLPSWLEESARVGGDDVSAVLLVREPLTDDTVAAPPRTRELEDAAGETPPVLAVAPPARRRRAGVVAVLSAAAAVLGVVAALLLLGPGRTEGPPTTPGEPTTSATPTGPDDGTSTSTGQRTEKRGRRDSGSPAPERPEKKQTPGGTDGGTSERPVEPEKPLPGQG